MNRALLLLLVMLVALASCKTTATKNGVSLKGDKKPADELMDSLNKHHIDFEWLSFKAKVDYDDGKRSENFTANIRMRKDSVIWASITSLMGIEVARMLVTRDSFEVLDKIKKKHTKRPFSALANNLPITTISMLQDLLVGNYLIDTSGNKRSKIEKDHYVLEIDNDHINANYMIAPTGFHLESLDVKEKNSSRKLNVSLGDYHIDGGYDFSFERTLNFKTDKSKLKVHIRFSKIIWNEPTTFPFYISDKYE